MNHRRGNDGGRAEPLAAETDFLFIQFAPPVPEVAIDLLDTCESSVRQYIALGGTDAPGVFDAVKTWLSSHGQWYAVLHRPVEPGLLVLKRNPNYVPPPGFGPGTELKKLLAAMGIEPDPSCDCNAKAIQMDLWGVAGCRENRETIIGWLKEGQERWGWSTLIAGVFKRIRSGWPTTTPAPWDESHSWLRELMRFNPLDPIGSLVDAAILRAE